MYVATASPRPKRTAFDGSRGGECALCSPPLDPPLRGDHVSLHGDHVSLRGDRVSLDGDHM